MRVSVDRLLRSLRRIDGPDFDLLALRGRPVVLDFFTTWCPACQSEAPAFVSLAQRLSKANDVVRDSRTSFGSALPTSLFVERHGRIVQFVPHSLSMEQSNAYVDALVALEPPPAKPR